MKKEIFLCAISNISSGACREDCKFCTQSIKHHAKIERYAKKPISSIVEEAKRAKELGALGFCLVTSGKGISSKSLEHVTTAAKAVKKEVDINLIACNGTATLGELKELKNAGIDSYNHNLETAESFYPEICTTHDWGERYETCINVKRSGLKLCSGGIFGMGESEKQRLEFMDSIAELSPASAPINFYHHNEALNLPPNQISIETALNIISTMKNRVPSLRRLMVAGGREVLLKDRVGEIFKAGANSIVIGDYLTTKGANPHKDIEMLSSLNLKIATECDDG